MGHYFTNILEEPELRMEVEVRSDEVVQIPDQRTVGGGHYQDRGQGNLLPLINKGWFIFRTTETFLDDKLLWSEGPIFPQFF